MNSIRNIALVLLLASVAGCCCPPFFANPDASTSPTSLREIPSGVPTQASLTAMQH